MSRGWAVTGQKTWGGAGRSPAMIGRQPGLRFLPTGLGLDGQGVADPDFQKETQPQAAISGKWRMGGAKRRLSGDAETG